MRIWKLIFLGLLISATNYCTSPCRGNTSVLCIESERQALLRFKQDLMDPDNRLNSWSAAELDCCNWTGIVCDSLTGHVQELNLSYSKSEYDQGRSMFSGSINLSLLELKHLKLLDLSYNNFGGNPIPSFIGSLVSLRYLKLSMAGFKGLVPHQLGNLSSLHYLVVEGNYERDGRNSLYVDNLDWLSSMPSLLHLDLSFVNLSGVSDWLLKINTLPSLSELHLIGCHLTHFPTLSTVNFTSLSVLDVSSNTFSTSVPKWIFTLNNLVSLEFSYCGFTGPIQPNFSNLTSLTIIDFSHNDFEGLIFIYLSNFASLRMLDLSGNHFVGSMGSHLFSLTSLTYLLLYQNNFTGPVPAYFSNLTSLTDVDLSYNNFEGPILKFLSNFTSLRTLYLSSNYFVGSIGTHPSNLTSLTNLDLSSNNFHGSIPNCFSQLTSLTDLHLSENNFHGSIPNCFSQLTSLRWLSLSQNSFHGSVPEFLTSMTSLYGADFSYNQLTGTLPPSLGNLSNLELFYIDHNLLQGDVFEVHFANLTSLEEFTASYNFLSLRVSPAWVPPFRLSTLELRNWNIGPQFPIWIRSQDYLRSLDLSSTGISDKIPSWLWNITSQIDYLNLSHNQIQGPLPRISRTLSLLDLSNNFFSGSISRFLCHQVHVSNEWEILNLGGNRLSGEIPNCWINWPSMIALKLGDNNLSGSVPSTLGYLQNLLLLDLRNNSLSGNIPVSLRNCTSLRFLDLGLNDFAGEVPAWLGSFSELMVLNLRSNKLHGKIPSEICHLESLRILDIADNNLSGNIPKCLSNLTAMVYTKNRPVDILYSGASPHAFMMMKGRNVEYITNILSLATGIDLSNNNLSGEIPDEITTLVALISLNLSGNHLTGELPNNIGRMKALESIDLSKNKITGKIPPSMANLNFLGYLDLSYNNLSGEIPSSTQLQSLESFGFIGNNLCGAPLTISCKKDDDEPQDRVDGNEKKSNNDGAKIDEFYLGLVLGFVVGFWAIFGSLLYCRSWRHAYFQFLNKIWIKFYVMFNKFRC